MVELIGNCATMLQGHHVALSMWQAACGKQYVASSMWQVVCGKQHVASSMWQAACGARCAACQMHCASCCLPDAVCQMLHAKCCAPDADWPCRLAVVPDSQTQTYLRTKAGKTGECCKHVYSHKPARYFVAVKRFCNICRVFHPKRRG